MLAKHNCYKREAVKHACVSAHREVHMGTLSFLTDALMNCSFDFYFKNSSLFHAGLSAQIACVYETQFSHGCLALPCMLKTWLDWKLMSQVQIDKKSVFPSSWKQCMFWHVFFICVFYFPVIYSFVCGLDLLAEHMVKSPIKPTYPLLH